MKLIVEENNKRHVLDADSTGKMNKLFNAYLDKDVETVTVRKKGNDRELVYTETEYEKLEEELKISMKYWGDTEVKFLLQREKNRGLMDGFKIGAAAGGITTIGVAIAIILILL